MAGGLGVVEDIWKAIRSLEGEKKIKSDWEKNPRSTLEAVKRVANASPGGAPSID